MKSGNDVLMDDYLVIAYGVQQGSGPPWNRLRPATTPRRAGRNAELLEKFNVGLAELKDSGEYQEILTSSSPATMKQ